MNNIITLANIHTALLSDFATTAPAEGYEGGMEINAADALDRIATALNFDEEQRDFFDGEITTACTRLHNGIVAALEAASEDPDYDLGEYAEACEYIADCFATATPVDDDRIAEILSSQGKQIER